MVSKFPFATRLALTTFRTGLAAAFALGTATTQAAVITQTASDTGAESSFNTGLHWSDGLAPSAANGYTSTSLALRTPSAAGNFTFQGQYLQTLFTGLVIKSTTNGSIITINDYRMMRGSTVGNAGGGSLTFNFNGNISLDPTNVQADGSNAAGFQLINNNGGINVNAAISGAGILKISTDVNTTTQFTNAISLTHVNNTYTGGTFVTANALLAVQADGALGTGKITLSGGKIKFELGTTNNYIADTANFVLNTGLATGAVDLNFAGSDTIGGLSLNNGSTFLAPGTYTTSALNTLYGSNVFTGTGTLTVVPEPSTVALLIGSFAFLLGRIISRRRRSIA